MRQDRSSSSSSSTVAYMYLHNGRATWTSVQQQCSKIIHHFIVAVQTLATVNNVKLVCCNSFSSPLNRDSSLLYAMWKNCFFASISIFKALVFSSLLFSGNYQYCHVYSSSFCGANLAIISRCQHYATHSPRCCWIMKVCMCILGLPNVRKSSTLFNALAQQSIAQAANFPFCTIDPNFAKIAVPDPYLESLGNFAMSYSRKVPAIWNG
jgi:hypothetical protein